MRLGRIYPERTSEDEGLVLKGTIFWGQWKKRTGEEMTNVRRSTVLYSPIFIEWTNGTKYEK